MANPWSTLADEDLTPESVHAHLDPCADDRWVAAACFDRLVFDIATQRTLIDIGLQRSASALTRTCDIYSNTASSSQSNTNLLFDHFLREPLDAQVCHIRARLRERLDRLNTYVELQKELVAKGSEDADDEWEDDPWADEDLHHKGGQEDKSTVLSIPDFLTDDLPVTALSLAAQEQLPALGVLVERHGDILFPHRFTILESIPEHVPPSDYRQLLPIYDPLEDCERRWSSKVPRSDTDWTDNLDVQSTLEQVGIKPPPSHERIPGAVEAPLSSSALLRWYHAQIDRIISRTGNVDTALALTQHGASSGLSGLDEVGEDLSLLSRLVYDTPRPATEDEGHTLSGWSKMSPSEVVQSYLSKSTPATVVKNIQRLVIPYLFVLESRAERSHNPDPSLRNRLLYEYIVNASLEMAAPIFEASKPTLPVVERLIKDDEDLARIALALLYGSDSLDEWATMSRIFECMPAWDSVYIADADEEDEADTTITSLGTFVAPSTAQPRVTASDLLLFFQPLHASSLSRALDVLDVHLESGEILSRWNVPARLRWFLQSADDENEQRSWARRMARRAGGSSDEPDSPEEYEWLLEDMVKLSNAGGSGLRSAFGLIPKDEVISIFLSGLLNSGKFHIAETLLHKPDSKISLSPTAIEDICLSCSREFYDNATDGNYKVGDMSIAYNCLTVPRPSDRIVREQEFIEATSRICSFNVTSRPGIPISPIEIRLTKDRLSLISRVLSSNSEAYKHTEVILDLVRKLGFKGDPTAEIKTLGMIADVALQNEDFDRAYKIDKRIIDFVANLKDGGAEVGEEVKEVCWVACYQLGRQPEFEDVQKKLHLLGCALQLCPPERVVEILAAWRRVDEEDLEIREEELGSTKPLPSKNGRRGQTRPNEPGIGLKTIADRLQKHIPPSPLVHTPDAALLASKTFSHITANFPFSVRSSSRASQRSDGPASPMMNRVSLDQDDGRPSMQASRVIQKGIGWLIGADEE
ncbi:secretory pathway protein Sec39-domain-containing protein [Thelephora terrestris]|uniref:Secretory pathway protein Sec39-domain-containing protein n=1 Tax=Thelephora terrestris TaxID=56493 RepID=A0A9P6HJ08_9AGAM|nr:secretory pathway protein Sec39-domain-containing protein [Thelephora terrestris]